MRSGARIDHSKCLLHIATENNNLDIAEILVNSGAILNLSDAKGNTPLMVACMGFSLSIAEFLLQKGRK